MMATTSGSNSATTCQPGKTLEMFGLAEVIDLGYSEG